MRTATYESWGRFPRFDQKAVRFRRDSNPFAAVASGTETILPFGNGRSYGDSCLNEGGFLLDCSDLNRILAFDAQSGRIRCESGILLSDILEHAVPKGWFLPVTPGTKFVSVGGAIANDIHGKNHHCAGTFGCHIIEFELLRSDGSRRICSHDKNADLFRATIGGLGLTGIITWAEIRLKKIAGPTIDQEVIKFANLSEFFAVARQSDRTHEYTVAWIDALAKGRALGRGHFIRGNHGEHDPPVSSAAGKQRFSIPFELGFSVVNRASLKLFNTLYYYKQARRRGTSIVHYEPFFYPLDAIGNWNRLYGPRGLLQHQCVLPEEIAEDVISEMLERTARAGQGSFLTVLKLFGAKSSPGILSFPRPGATLTLDFSNKGRSTLQLLGKLDELTMAAGGTVNPYKDARMSAECFQASFPNWRKLLPFLDPRISSSFWRRVTDAS